LKARPRTDAGPAKRLRGRPKGSGSVEVYGALRERILSLHLPPGAEIDEPALRREFAVSRTPIREALLRLAAEELVDLVPNRTARVSPINFMEVSEVFEAFELCQRFVTRLACHRHQPQDLADAARHAEAYENAARVQNFRAMAEANHRFHCAIARGARNRLIAETYQRLLDRTLRMASLVLRNAFENDVSYKEYIRRVVSEHAEMLRLIAAGQADAADRLAMNHAQLFKERVAAYILDKGTGEFSLQGAGP
jgi:DNA-binding GntR family transcriptional regulator